MTKYPFSTRTLRAYCYNSTNSLIKNDFSSIICRLMRHPFEIFLFSEHKHQQYQQVGNAVPPILAKAIAEKLAEALSK